MGNNLSIKVMIVDDSLVVRGLIRKILEQDRAFEIVASCTDGEAAVSDYKQFLPDIVLMDIEMPHMDGLTALQNILKYDGNAKVVMCSSLTQSGAKTTYQALNLGAIDCLVKPSSSSIDRGEVFEEKLKNMLKALGRGKPPANVNSASSSREMRNDPSYYSFDKSFTLRSFPLRLPISFPSAIAIGASTGGPNALPELFKAIDKKIGVPVFITQHVPTGFEDYLAQTITKHSGFPVKVAEAGMTVEPGIAYLARAGKHLGVSQSPIKKIELIDTPPVNFCKPSINVMLESLKDAYRKHILSVMLTGMGTDGAQACRELVDDSEHNIILAQDEQSSVVWGIPGAVAHAGLCHGVYPLNELGEVINSLVFKQLLLERN